MIGVRRSAFLHHLSPQNR